VDTKLTEILDKMCQIYRKFGIKSITMDDAARENSISKKTLYKFVKDKADLVRQTTAYGHTKHIEGVKSIMNSSNSAIDDFFDLFSIVGEVMSEYNPAIDYDLRKYYPSIFKEVETFKSKMVYDFHYNNLLKGIKQGIFIPSLNAVLISKQQAMLMSSSIDNEIVSYKDFINKEAVLMRFTYHLRAICNAKGLEILNKKVEFLEF